MSGISFTQAVLCALLYWLINTYWCSFWNFQNLQWPVCHGLLIGILMGDPIQGTILGGTIQTLNMAPSMIGFTTTMDMCLAGFVCIPMVIGGVMDADTAVAMATPFMVFGAFIQPFLRTLNTVCVNFCDKAAAEGDTKKFFFGNTFLPAIIAFPFRAIVLFVILFYGQVAISAIIGLLPAWVLQGLSVLSKFLPGIGFAIFLNAINRVDLIPLFLLGFYVFYYFKSTGLNMIAMTIFGALIAIILCRKKGAAE